MSDESDRQRLLEQLAAAYRTSQRLPADAPLKLIDKDHPHPGVPYEPDGAAE